MKTGIRRMKNDTFANVNDYIEWKLYILRHEFLIKATEEEIENMNSLKTFSSVDRYFNRIILTHWEEDKND